MSRDKLNIKLINYKIYGSAFYGLETRTPGTLEQKYAESFKMWRRRRMEKIKFSAKVTNEEVLERVGEKKIPWVEQPIGLDIS